MAFTSRGQLSLIDELPQDAQAGRIQPLHSEEAELRPRKSQASMAHERHLAMRQPHSFVPNLKKIRARVSPNLSALRFKE
jgi:hypothetical protein